MKTLLLISTIALLSFTSSNKINQAELDTLIDNWHLAATNAKFDDYFGATTDDFIFLGTDPTERWTKEQFMSFSKPYFDKGKAWDFKKIERNWVFDKSGKIAWFDESLNTWMRDCRGSGIVVKEGKKWKLKYYNLTVLIENDKIQKFIELRDKKE
jgi:hypothetical protein